MKSQKEIDDLCQYINALEDITDLDKELIITTLYDLYRDNQMCHLTINKLMQQPYVYGVRGDVTND